MKKLLIVVDYQKDFVDGSLGFAGAEALDASIAQRIADYHAAGNDVVFTLDTHGTNYAQTQEGRKLPVPHCLYGSSMAPPPPPVGMGTASSASPPSLPWSWLSGSKAAAMPRWSCAGWSPTSAFSPTR